MRGALAKVQLPLYSPDGIVTVPVVRTPLGVLLATNPSVAPLPNCKVAPLPSTVNVPVPLVVAPV